MVPIAGGHCQIGKTRLKQYMVGCPWCKKEECICSPGATGYTLAEPGEKPKKLGKKHVPQATMWDHSGWTLGEWEKKLENIYGKRNNTLEWLQVAARLTEQAGNVAKVIR